MSVPSGGQDFAHEEVARVELVVAQELVGRAVELVGAGFGRHRDHPGAAPELGGEDARQHLELTDLFDRGGDDDGVEGELVVVDAVDEPRVGVGLTAERVEVRRAARIEGAGARQVLAGLPRRNPRRQVDEGREVPSIQRQFLDRLLLDHGPDLGRVGAHERRLANHGRLFRQRPHLERGVDSEPIVHLQHDPAACPRLEALQLDRYLVGARHQERRSVDAGRIRRERGRRVLVDVADGHQRAWHDRAGRIHDGAHHASRGHLGDGRGREREEGEDGENRTELARTPQRGCAHQLLQRRAPTVAARGRRRTSPVTGIARCAMRDA